MRKLRRILQLVVPAVGMALVLGAVLYGTSIPVQLFLVIAGLMLTEAGLWRLAEPLLPDERRFLALRAETDHFMALVRQLNATALEIHGRDGDGEGDGPVDGPVDGAVDGAGGAHAEGARFALAEIHSEMHRAIDRMVRFAGTTADDAAARVRPGSGTP